MHTFDNCRTTTTRWDVDPRNLLPWRRSLVSCQIW